VYFLPLENLFRSIRFAQTTIEAHPISDRMPPFYEGALLAVQRRAVDVEGLERKHSKGSGLLWGGGTL
jgi:hypothetical protein